jgi:hypothetical protein
VAAKPDGKQRNERITFSRPAAERIAKVVRQVESGDRNSSGVTFRRVPPQSDAGDKNFRICTFTGAWATSDTKTVTFKYQTTTPNTVLATNLFASISDTGGTQPVAIAKEGTEWHAIEFLRTGDGVVRLAIYTATSSWLPISPFSTSQATTSHVRKIQFVFPTATVSQTSGPAGVPNGQTAMCVNNMAFLGAVTTVVTASITLITVMKEGGEWRLIGATR